MAAVAVGMVLAALPVSAQQLPSGEPLFATASVDNDRPYIGQQVTYIAKIYQRSDFPRRFRYEPPGFTGFWNVQATEGDDDYDELDDYDETVGSNQYSVIELRYFIFPSVVETLDIEPGVLTVPASPSEGSIVVESVSVPVDVRPLPTGAPAGFTGAVGRFEISAHVDNPTVRMNEAVQLTVTIQGAGNIEALPAPSWPEFPGWRVIESPAAASIEVVDGQLVGSRIYESVLVPESPGELSVPEISYAYFDPDREEYARVTTSPISVSVVAADGETPLPQPSVGGVEDEPAHPGTRRVRAVPPSLSKSGRSLTENVAYWAMWGLPLLAIAGALVWRRRRDAWEAALADSRRRNALPNAQSTLARAGTAGDDYVVSIAYAVQSYLSDRFGEPLTGLTREALGQRLEDAGVPAELSERAEEILASGEAARYTPEAPPEVNREDRIRRAAQLLTELDGAIGA